MPWGRTEAGISRDPAPLQHAAGARDICRQHEPRVDGGCGLVRNREVVVPLGGARWVRQPRLHSAGTSQALMVQGVRPRTTSPETEVYGSQVQHSCIQGGDRLRVRWQRTNAGRSKGVQASMPAVCGLQSFKAHTPVLDDEPREMHLHMPLVLSINKLMAQSLGA